MTIKYLHIRNWDQDTDEILNTGGITVAYTYVGAKDIAIQIARCHEDDNFCYRIGRQIAAGRLTNEGPLDILDVEYIRPSDAIVSYLINEYYSNEIDVRKCRNRFVSTFGVIEEVDLIPMEEISPAIIEAAARSCGC